jgi:DNA-binding winged helix-turn-helix (wHTH) protein/tetratricopeptide (TPR) repeat protein
MRAFGPFRLDTANHCLWRADERAPLTPKAFDVLRYLVEHADCLVTQNELLEALWPETYINPEGIRKYILEIRKVLGDRPGQPAFIQTSPKRGYQFVAPLTDDRKVARLDSAPQPPDNMVGRRAALRRLDRSLQIAFGGQRQVVFITGEAGIGKTTLVDVFQQQAVRRPDFRIARGQCIEGFGGKEAYYPMLESLGSLLQDEEGGSLVQTLAARAPTWLIQFPALLKPEQKESLQREILGSTRERMVREICEALEVITAQTPLIVILEDLHWVDPSTLDLISAVARRREPARLLLIGTYRPVDVVLSQSPLKTLKQDLLVRSLCHEIAIEQLEESDVAEYLAKLFTTGTLPPGLANLIHQNSGGNPLFMVAIVQDLLNKGLIAADQGRWILTAPLQEVYPGIPDTLQQMLEIQLEQLSPEEQRILESGSVAGKRFSAWAAGAMLEASPTTIEEACDRLANRQQFIRSVGIHDGLNGAASAHYEFRHALYRQVLYRRLSSSNRSKLHQRLGEHLVAVCTAGKRELASELALHFEQGRDYEHAVRYLMLTAENASQRFAHGDSVQILRQALELVPALPAGTRLELEIQILQRIGDAHYASGAMSNSASAYETAAARAVEAGLKTAQVDALSRLAVPAWYLDPVRGNEICQEALEVSGSLADPLLLARTQLSAACFRLLYDEWRREDEETCANAQDTICRLSGSSILPDVFYIYVQTVQGNYREALKQAEALISATTNPTVHVLALGIQTLILMGSGHFGEFLRIVRTGQELAQRNGEDPWLFIFREAWLRWLCFDFEGVGRLSQIIRRSDAEQHAAEPQTMAKLASGYVALYRGRSDEALRYFANVRDPRITPKFLLHWRWRLRAQLGSIEARLQTGDLENARREADDFLESAFSTGEPNLHAYAWEARARVAIADKDGARALACIERALPIVDKFDIPLSAWRVHATACDSYSYAGDKERAAEHRARAKALIMRMADSFEYGEPLRESLLSAPPVRRIFGEATAALDAAASRERRQANGKTGPLPQRFGPHPSAVIDHGLP